MKHDELTCNLNTMGIVEFYDTYVTSQMMEDEKD